MNDTQEKKNSTKVRVYVDIFFFALMVLVLIPQTTGIPIHEWASFVIIIPFFLHLIINWNWVVTNSSKFFKKEPNKTRFDYAFNWLLYLVMVTITISGIVISESALPAFGIHFEPDRFWSVIHDVSASLFMLLLGVHITLHWKWIVGSIKKIKFKTDLHHLTEIKSILFKRSLPLLFIIVMSVFFSLVIWLFDYSALADSVRANSDRHDHDSSGDDWKMYVLPLVKVTMFITISAFFTGAIIRLKKKIISKIKKSPS